MLYIIITFVVFNIISLIAVTTTLYRIRNRFNQEEINAFFDRFNGPAFDAPIYEPTPDDPMADAIDRIYG